MWFWLLWRAWLLIIIAESLSMLTKFYNLKVHILKRTIITKALLTDVVFIIYIQRLKSSQVLPWDSRWADPAVCWHAELITVHKHLRLSLPVHWNKMEMTVIKCHLAADSPALEALLLCFPQTSWVKRPFFSLFFFFWELLHLSALLFVPQSSHSRSADAQVSLSSNAPSDWLRPPSEATLFFFCNFSHQAKEDCFFIYASYISKKNLIVWLRENLAALSPPSFSGGRVRLWPYSLCRPPLQRHTHGHKNECMVEVGKREPA